MLSKQIMIAGAMLMAAPTALSAQAATAAAEIKALAKAHIAAFNARDAAGATSIDAADYVGFFHGTPNIIGHAAERCTYRYTYTDPATRQPRVELGNYIIGFKRQPDGRMKAAWSVVSDTPPAAS